MEVEENASLAEHSAMRLGGNARWLANAYADDEISELIAWAEDKKVPFIIIGQGSNIVWRDEGFAGLVIVNKIRGKTVLSEDTEGATLSIGAGEVWDEVVAWTVENGWSGIEFLSAIPGTAGAGPVQNIGAYGAELSDTLVEVNAYDTQKRTFVSLPRAICDFSYRSSRFKGKDKGRYAITGIVLRLGKNSPQPPFYESLEKYFKEHNIRDYTPENIRKAVIAIRSVKLPDPSVVANNGSFFTNPFVSEEEFKKLQQKYPDIKGWPTVDGKVKLAAGWLVEKAGFKGVYDQGTGMATWPHQALVLVNKSARKTTDLLAFKQQILDKVHELFGVKLDQEPELLP